MSSLLEKKYELSLIFLEGSKNSFSKGMDLVRLYSNSLSLFYFEVIEADKPFEKAELFWSSSSFDAKNMGYSYYPEIFEFNLKFKDISKKLLKGVLVTKKKPDFNFPDFINFIDVSDFETICFVPCFVSNKLKGFMTAVSKEQEPDVFFLDSVSNLVGKSVFFTKTFLCIKNGESKFRSILDNIEDGYFETDLKGNLIAFNNSVCRIAGVGRNELKGVNNREYTTPETAKNMFRVFSEIYKTNIPLKIRDYEVILKNNEKKWVELSASLIKNDNGEAVGFRGLVRDVTSRKKSEDERKKLEEKLNQAQRLEAVGTLAGGIAHDFNNLLMAIQGNASLIMSASKGNNVVAEKVLNIEKCVESGASLIKQLLGFARGGKYVSRPCSLNRVIDASLVMFSRANKNITIERIFDDDLYQVEADISQIEQVLMNLFFNAESAMDGRGQITIKTKNVYLTRKITSVHDLVPGDYAELEISDTGKGMEPEIIKRIFDPFFTTKKKGRGTGLGLASVFGIVKNHGGFINVASFPGRGSSFKIYFPAFKSDYDKKIDISKKDLHLKKQKKVLIADDDQAILDVCAEMLTEAGYHVETASGGYEALNIFMKKSKEIDIVILDILMPDLDGFETYRELKKIDKNVLVLFCSGYIEEEQYQKEDFGDEMKGSFISKPYNLTSLKDKIESLFEQNL
jgi:PAS domain S-box-containing protein